MTQNALLHPQRLSHRLSFSLFSPCPSGIGGFPVTWGLDSPSHVLTLVLSYLFLSLQAISFQFPRLDAHLALPFLSLLAPRPPSLGWVSCPHLSACLQHVCDRAALQEGRQADDHWDLQWLRSGANGAHGEHVFPCLCGMPKNTNSMSWPSLTNSCSTLWQRVISLSARTWACNRQKKREKSLLEWV